MQLDLPEHGQLTAVFNYSAGNSPLFVSIPHDGRNLAPGQAERMTDVGRTIPDTDWHVAELYDFVAELNASVISANYSRYVVDLNRAADDAVLYAGQLSTGLCPEKTFDGKAIYVADQVVSADERAERVKHYWRPYHAKVDEHLAEIRERFGYALLWDAHSIATRVPLLFEGALPDLNVGTNSGRSCSLEIEQAVNRVAQNSGFTSVLNGRFQGGHITRHFGNPAERIHAIQLELTQHNYMDESSLRFGADRLTALRSTIRNMLDVYVAAAASTH